MSESKYQVQKTDEEWRELLTQEQFQVARKKGTEAAGSGALTYNKDDGLYRCVCCETPLFKSDEKYDSGSGWPSFTEPVDANNIELETDTSYGMNRTEVMCSTCGAHLGHVFEDGPGAKRFALLHQFRFAGFRQKRLITWRKLANWRAAASVSRPASTCRVCLRVCCVHGPFPLIRRHRRLRQNHAMAAFARLAARARTQRRRHARTRRHGAG